MLNVCIYICVYMYSLGTVMLRLKTQELSEVETNFHYYYYYYTMQESRVNDSFELNLLC